MERTGVREFVFNGEKGQVCLQAGWKQQGKRGHFNVQKREIKEWNKVLVPDEMGRADGLEVTVEALKQDKGTLQLLRLERSVN